MTRHGFVVAKGTDWKTLNTRAQRIQDSYQGAGTIHVHVINGPYSTIAYSDGADVRQIIKLFMEHGLHDIEVWCGLDEHPPATG